MDKNSLIGILLIGAIIVTFSILNKPSEAEKEEAMRRRDSLEQAQQKREIENIKNEEIINTNQAELTEDKPAENYGPANLHKRFGVFANAAAGEQKFITLENDIFILKVATKGGRPYSLELKKHKTYDSLPLFLFNGDSTIFGFKFNTSSEFEKIFTNDMFFIPADDRLYYDAKTSEQTLKLKLIANENSYIEYVYTIKPGSHMVGFNINFMGMNSIIASNTTNLDFTWFVYSPQQEKGAKNENNYTAIGYKFQDGEVGELRSMRKETDSKEINTKLNWIAFKQQFFSSIFIADNHFSYSEIEQTTLTNSPKYLKTFKADMGISYESGANQNMPFHFYFGPNRYKTLKKYDKGFEELVELGNNVIRWVNIILIIPVFNFLEKYFSSYGLIILLLTIFIKILVFPLTYKSYTSGAKMRVLKPQIDEITKKFTKPEDAMKKQQATMALYKKVGISPLGGCLPMLIQFPFLIAMFRFFPTAFELRQKSFLWAEDLSTYDSVFQLPFTVPFGYGDHVSLFTLLMTISTIIYTKLNSEMSSAANQQMPGMKVMMYFMPVMLLFWFNNYSSGLSYYYLLANLISFAQMFIIKRFVDEEEILRKLNERAEKKTVTKSKFQQRLERMAKDRGVNLKK